MLEAASSGLPRPKLYAGHLEFVTKEEVSLQRRSYAPEPPVKRNQRESISHATALSFREGPSDHLTMSRLYDTTKPDPYFRQCFDVLEDMGRGSFAVVYKVRDKEDGRLYAVKRFKNRRNVDRKRQEAEVKHHECIPPHPNIVKFYGAWKDDDQIYMKMELCDMALADYLETNHRVPEYLVWNYLVDLLRALKHLHDRELVHLDVKPENILISHHGILKLGDFGLVYDLKDEGSQVSPTEGDSKYLAPELIEKGLYTKAADVFSLGLTILEVAVDLNVPGSGDLWQALRESQLPLSRIASVGLSDELVQVIRIMLNPDPLLRPSVGELLQLDAVKRHLMMRQWKTAAWDKVDDYRETMLGFSRKTMKLVLFAFWWIFGWFQSSNAPSSVSTSESPLLDSPSNMRMVESDEDESKNGTPPHVQSSFNNITSMRAKTARKGSPIFSAVASGANLFKATSTPVHEMQKPSCYLNTPHLTPVPSRSPRSVGSAMARRRLNMDESEPSEDGTPAAGGDSQMLSRNLFARTPADVSADEEEEKVRFGGTDGENMYSGSPSLRRRAASKKKILKKRGPSAAGKGPGALVTNLSKKFGPSSDVE
ncbi:unnamed protein product [Notodromas monacha]|uniref:non-specific serine/threonine protein kinase n=1 Tax=Notodromas monacha TaxID=399045 RepID=A0A7R9GAS1_9CRUS|nr:unnamed protein product [Notodromas monacha]CAG0915749.1 unnamed protein product [Notodromas monacha]